MNRLRVFVLHRGFDRKNLDPLVDILPTLQSAEAKYSGFGTHAYGRCNPAHFFLIDDPTDEQIAVVMALQRDCAQEDRFELHVMREFRDTPKPTTYSLDTIMDDVARIVLSPETKMMDRALCWSGVQVLANMAVQTR